MLCLQIMFNVVLRNNKNEIVLVGFSSTIVYIWINKHSLICRQTRSIKQRIKRAKYYLIELFDWFDYSPQTTRNKMVAEQRLSKLKKFSGLSQHNKLKLHKNTKPHIPNSPSQLPNPHNKTHITDSPKQNPPIRH